MYPSNFVPSSWDNKKIGHYNNVNIKNICQFFVAQKQLKYFFDKLIAIHGGNKKRTIYE